MEMPGEISSLPSNYVTILDLRERWLKENEPNQREKEEQRQPERQVQDQKVRRRQPEEKHEQKPEVDKPAVQKARLHTNSWRKNGSGQFQRYYRVVASRNARTVNERCTKTEAEGEPLLADPRIGRDGKKKKSKRKGDKKNPRAQKEEMDRTSRTPEENLEADIRETEYVLGVHDGKKNVKARRTDEKKGIGSQCGAETGNTHGMKEMENKLSRISVSFDIKRGRNNSVYRGSSQGNQIFRVHQNLHRRGPRKQRDVGMIWVRKDELPKGANS